jgi:hypothetical protein
MTNSSAGSATFIELQRQHPCRRSALIGPRHGHPGQKNRCSEAHRPHPGPPPLAGEGENPLRDEAGAGQSKGGALELKSANSSLHKSLSVEDFFHHRARAAALRGDGFLPSPRGRGAGVREHRNEEPQAFLVGQLPSMQRSPATHRGAAL